MNKDLIRFFDERRTRLVLLAFTQHSHLYRAMYELTVNTTLGAEFRCQQD